MRLVIPLGDVEPASRTLEAHLPHRRSNAVSHFVSIGILRRL
jgi:hypothetical protein